MNQVRRVVLSKDLAEVKEGDPCPYGDGGVFKPIKCGDSRRVYVGCSVNPEHHWRWQTLAESGIAQMNLGF
jgi:hypothetical protein